MGDSLRSGGASVKLGTREPAIGNSGRSDVDRPPEGAGFSLEAGPRLLELSSDLVCVCRGHRISYVNPAGARLLEAGDGMALIGRPFTDFVDADYSGAVDDFLVALVDEPASFPARLRGLAGAEIGAELSVFRLPEWGDDAMAVFAKDITHRVRLSEAIHRSESRYRRLVANARDMICVCDGGVVSFINRSGTGLLGTAGEDRVVGRPFTDFLHPDYREIFAGGIGQVIGEKSRLPVKLVCFDGEVRDVELTVSPLDSALAERYMVEAWDITDHNRAVAALHQANLTLETRVRERTRELAEEVEVRKKAEDMYRRAASHDALTGLPNRYLLLDRLAGALARARREDTLAAVMFLDLDGFKAVNDTLGHDAGDFLLREVAKKLASSVRQTDTVARFGGDEFIIVLTALTERDTVAGVAGKILEVLSEPVAIDGAEARVGGSIGIALYPEHGETPEQLLGRADSAMYEVKQAGRNGYRFASSPKTG